MIRIKNEYDAAQRRERLVAEAYNGQLKLVDGQASKSVHYDILKREADTNHQIYESMLQKVKEAGIVVGHAVQQLQGRRSCYDRRERRISRIRRKAQPWVHSADWCWEFCLCLCARERIAACNNPATPRNISIFPNSESFLQIAAVQPGLYGGWRSGCFAHPNSHPCRRGARCGSCDL